MASRGVGHHSIGYTDADVLQILWRKDAKGQTGGQIAAIHGITRNAVLGLLHRCAHVDFMPDHFSDSALLAMVDRVGSGVAANVVAKDFGIMRFNVLALVHAVRLDLARAGGCTCERAENRDGGMPAQWWRDGLAAQVAA